MTNKSSPKSEPEIQTMIFKTTITGKLVSCFTSVIAVAFPFAFSIVFSAPTWCTTVLSIAASASILHTVSLFFSYVEINRNGIFVHGFLRRSYPWERIRGWSQLGGKYDAIFFLLDDQSVHGFDSWCVAGKRLSEAAKVLQIYVGDPATGSETIMPPILQEFIGDSFEE